MEFNKICLKLNFTSFNIKILLPAWNSDCVMNINHTTCSTNTHLNLRSSGTTINSYQ